MYAPLLMPRLLLMAAIVDNARPRRLLILIADQPDQPLYDSLKSRSRNKVSHASYSVDVANDIPIYE